jgi:uncharacterized protein (TIGR03437 family)
VSIYLRDHEAINPAFALYSYRGSSMKILKMLTLLYLPVAGAQGLPNWTQKNPLTSPSVRQDLAMAYDSAHSQIVIFGGANIPGALNETWVWDGSNWTQKFPATSPPARFYAAMAYDSAHGQIVLFGGDTGINTGFNDTWVWDGTNWTEKFPATNPVGRYGHAMAYDSAHGQVVLFGGTTGGLGGLLADTWVWDGSTWTKKTPLTSPPAVLLPAMAYDSAHSQAVLFGGNSSSGVLTGTWIWDGAAWTQKTAQTSPPSRYGAMLDYDSAHSEIVLFGGTNSVNLLNDTWFWNGSAWTQQMSQNSPPARAVSAMAYDSTNGVSVIFGGNNNGYSNDTWTLNSGPLPILVTQVVSASDFGGFSTVAPGSWVEIHGTNLAPDTRSWLGSDFTGNNAPTSLDGVKVTAGGQAAFVEYISPTQVNAQLPSNVPTGGAVQLTVNNGTSTSAPVNITVSATEPGLLAPASFLIGGKQYVVAQFTDGTYVLPTGAIAGVASRPAKPGESIVIYGVGFGSVTPSIPAGQIVTVSNQVSAPFALLFGQTQAQLPYSGLAPNFVGLYQFNVVVPAVPDNNLVPLTFTLGGVAGTQTLFTAVHQ